MIIFLAYLRTVECRSQHTWECQVLTSSSGLRRAPEMDLQSDDSKLDAWRLEQEMEQKYLSVKPIALILVQVNSL